jgi:hypothetical protein
MKRSLLAAPMLVALGVAGFALASTTSTVTLGPTGPSTTAVNVYTGDTVVWSNGGPGTVGLELPSMSVTAALPPAATYMKQFTVTGHVPFHEVIGTGNAAKSYKGVVNVAVPTLNGTVDLKASAHKIKAGSYITLSGTIPVSAELPGPRMVTLEQQVHGAGGWSSVASHPTAVADETGHFSVRLKPALTTNYRASVDSGRKQPLTSSPQTVSVVPRFVVLATPLHVKTGSPVVITVRVLTHGAVHSILIQRQDTLRGGWAHLVTRAVPRSGVLHYTWTSTQGRTVIRAAVTPKGLAPGFDATTSNAVVVTGIGAPPPKPKKHKKH